MSSSSTSFGAVSRPTRTEGDATPRRRGYAQAWRWAPGTALYLVLLSIPTAILGMALTWSVFLVGVGSLVLVVGVPLIVAALFIARGFAVADIALQRLGGVPSFPAPDWERGSVGEGRWSRLTRPMRNGHYWMALLSGTIVRPVIAIFTFGVSTSWIVLALGGPTYWFWSRFIPNSRSEQIWVDWAVEHVFGGIDPDPDPYLWASMLYLAVGIVFLLTLPLVLRGLLFLHHAAAAGMLGRWEADDLGAQVAELDASRGAAIRAEDAALRRLERDIHDGPQQRLVRLQMDLATIERRAAAGDLEAATQLAQESRGHAQAALDELRALAGGVAPPLLQDRGIVESLRALGAASPLPVSASVDPEIGATLSPETARNLYFIVAELLTNAAKHSGAGAVSLTAARAGADVLVTVHDDGRGGAGFQAGHGLEGLRGRVQGLRGSIRIDSPEGGPTAITVRVPAAA
ncbi:signal transduction histidine kinase [Microbacterium resistens]|uniref:histidine kinase n=1 Tax=Microbacterium resistens TaxID=156977 RepID=A0ABU1SB27_9MICO|nr:sensor domain-containing protein [Microbacterium resistens]MDR6866077.1 signal transduction histidine kinase [Microbacterium resistens]